jgi:hypothetical protein
MSKPEGTSLLQNRPFPLNYESVMFYSRGRSVTRRCPIFEKSCQNSYRAKKCQNIYINVPTFWAISKVAQWAKTANLVTLAACHMQSRFFF